MPCSYRNCRVRDARGPAMNRRVMRRAWELAKPELDRIDPSGHYEPANIRFIEKTENYKRRRPWGTVEKEPAFLEENEQAAAYAYEPGSGG